MYFSLRPAQLLLLVTKLFLIVSASAGALGQEVTDAQIGVADQPSARNPFWVLRVMPDTCVTMQQGKECFQPLRISWEAPMSGDYCVHLSGEATPLQCWQSVSSGHYQFEFRDSQSRTMRLRRANQNEDLDSAVIDVKWVYRQRRAGIRWRVF